MVFAILGNVMLALIVAAFYAFVRGVLVLARYVDSRVSKTDRSGRGGRETSSVRVVAGQSPPH